MIAMNRSGKTYWLVELKEQQSVMQRIKAAAVSPSIHAGNEQAFMNQMARRSESQSFCISNPQLVWLDAVLKRCGHNPLLGS